VSLREKYSTESPKPQRRARRRRKGSNGSLRLGTIIRILELAGKTEITLGELKLFLEEFSPEV